MKFDITTPLAIHEIGNRDNQEDCIFPAEGEATIQDRLFVLCDGMGGHLSGEVASQTVCQVLSSYIQKADKSVPFTDEMLAEAIKKVYDALNEKDSSKSERRMGTTMVMLYFHAGGLMAAHIGDSRYYHIRPKERKIIYRSSDHSLATLRFQTGEISLQDIATMEGRNVILRVMMPNQEERDMPDIVHIRDIKPGDLFYMCSDGMLENMNDDELLNILCNSSMADEQKQSWLINSTANNSDNHSAYLIRITGVTIEEGDDELPDDETEALARNRLFLAEREQASTIENVTKGNNGMMISVSDQKENQTLTNSQTTTHPAPQEMPLYPPKPKVTPYWVWMMLTALFMTIFVMGYIFLRNDNSKRDSEPAPINRENVRNNRHYEEGGKEAVKTGTDNKQGEADKHIPERKKGEAIKSLINNIEKGKKKGKTTQKDIFDEVKNGKYGISQDNDKGEKSGGAKGTDVPKGDRDLPETEQQTQQESLDTQPL